MGDAGHFEIIDVAVNMRLRNMYVPMIFFIGD